MQSSNRSGIQCLQHPNQEITNYCLQFECLKPLCPDCVEVHYNSHHSVEIQSWKHCVNKSARNLKSTLDQLRQLYDRQNQYKSYKSVDQIQSENVRRLNQIRDKVMRAVEDFFNAQQQKLRAVIRSQYKIDPPNTTKLRMAIQELEKILMKLGHSGTALSALKKSLLLDHQSLVGYFSDLKSNERKGPATEVFIKQQYDFGRIRNVLEQSVRIVPLQTRTQDQYFSPQKHVFDDAPVSNRRPVQSSFSPLEITEKDYFSANCKQKNLHFFIPVSKQLKLLNVESASQGGYFKSVFFKSKAQLPYFFKSIITPDGEIYLTGGSQDQKRFREIYRYSYEKNSLEFVCKMINERSSHSICYLNRCIYIIGGFSKRAGDISRECQVFKLDTQSCEPIASLNAPSANSCATPFRNEYIFKFGGVLNHLEANNLIQMYSVKTNQWNVVNIDYRNSPKLQFLSFTAAIQLNHNDIQVFGGYENSEQEKPHRSSYTLEVSPENVSVSVKNFNMPALPFAQGFWSNNPIMHNKRVYAMQNVTDEEDQMSALADERRVLIFNGQRWIC